MELQNGIRILSIPSMAWLSDAQKQNVRVWIEALRSKKYEQGKGFLKTIDNKFCCLGVACDVVSDIFKTHWKGGPEDVCYSLE
ncbi:hypothetical protein BB65665_12991, partial [Bacillus sp. 916]|uniref:hypothetical protein n=1 Tax=Bacillus sp. 916 TaxID=1007654 RepID=UPI00026B9FA4